MKKRAKLTSTGHIPGALSRFEISDMVHDVKFSGSHQNTSREGRRQGRSRESGYPTRWMAWP